MTAKDMRTYHIHLVSDATGETVRGSARACLVQFEAVEAVEHVWPLVRTKGQIEKVVEGIEAQPGLVLFTLVNAEIRKLLEECCRRLQVPCVPVLDPIILAMASWFGLPSRDLPGRQHVMDAEYFSRIEAMNYALVHDDGQGTWDLEDADVIVLGVSRTSKTPTCIYLANRGIRAANIPIVPGCPLPSELPGLTRPLIVGLTKDPGRLVQIRRNRLLMLKQQDETDYTDIETVKREVADARRLCSQHNWPIIDVTRRSIEETAAAIIQLYNARRAPGRV